jgi:hypothetical protein
MHLLTVLKFHKTCHYPWRKKLCSLSLTPEKRTLKLLYVLETYFVLNFKYCWKFLAFSLLKYSYLMFENRCLLGLFVSFLSCFFSKWTFKTLCFKTCWQEPRRDLSATNIQECTVLDEMIYFPINLSRTGRGALGRKGF